MAACFTYSCVTSSLDIWLSCHYIVVSTVGDLWCQRVNVTW